MDLKPVAIDDSKVDSIFEELKGFRWTYATPFAKVINKVLGTNQKFDSTNDERLMKIAKELNEHFPVNSRNQMFLFNLSMPHHMETVPYYIIAKALTFWWNSFTEKLMDWLNNLPDTVLEGDRVGLSGVLNFNTRYSQQRVPDAKASEIAKKLKKLHISLCSLDDPGLTHIALGHNPEDAIGMLKNNPHLKVIGMGKLFGIAAGKAKTEEGSRFLKIEEEKGSTEMLDNLLQLLDSKDKSNIGLALEMIKTGGTPTALLEQLLLLAKTNTNAEIRKSAREILLKDAPPEWKLMINNATVFSLLEARNNSEIKRRLDEIKLVVGEPIEILRALFIKNFNLGGDVIRKTKEKEQKPQPEITNQAMTEAEAEAWWNQLSEPFKRIFQERGYKSAAQVNDLLAVKELEIWLQFVPDLAPLQYFKELTYLKFTTYNQVDLTPIGNLKKLTNLDLIVANYNPDLIFIKELTGLTELSLNVNQVKDTSFLKDLTKLTSFTLRCKIGDSTAFLFGEPTGTPNFDLSPLKYCEKLKSLDLMYNDMSDISCLSEMKSLTSIKLKYNKVTDISPLAKLPNLARLSIGYNDYLKDITPLAALTNLKELELTGMNFPDLIPLGNLTNLTKLNLEATSVTDITPLKNLLALTNLKLYCKPNNIKALECLVNLTRLDISSLDIEDITPLQELTEMKDLDISINKIKGLSPLKKMVKLKKLRAYYNKITDFSVLTQLPELESIDLTSNEITDATPVKQMPKLRKAILDGNPIDTAPYETVIGKVRSLMGLLPEKGNKI